jgi:hypothetical protein
LRESAAEHAAVSAVELPVAPPRGEDIVEFSDTRRLASGWIAMLQYSEKQDVRQDGNAKTKATVFRLTSETNGVIRFSKTMSLFDCRCIGTFDIDVPIFKTEPIARRKKQ